MAAVRPWNGAVLLTGMLVVHSVTQAAGLQKLWDFDLRKVIELSASHNRDLPVLALRFSPNGKKLAVVFDWYGPKTAQKSHLLVLDASRPDGGTQLFEIEAGIDENQRGERAWGFGWSASADIVRQGRRIIHLNGGRTCELPSEVAWIGNNRALGRDREDLAARDWEHPVSHFTFFDAACQPQDKWEMPGEWYISGASPDRGLVLLVSGRVYLPGPFTTERLIVDPDSRKILHRWSGPHAPDGQFADSGKAICGGSDVDAAPRAPVTCWDVDTREKIGEAPTANGGDPIDAALHASRLVASDYRRRRDPLSSYEYIEVFKRRVVWDFKSGKELFSWCPEFQSWSFQLWIDPSKPLKHVHEPFCFAISPDGQYVAEGGSGMLHLYKIEP